ncbi:arsenate reductase (glutaredoxin) [Oceanibacterium hippocampi]|uniref:Arsenate reductase n=1 Tax=Oceanibacterium hippocampi TaxID=745714 RepID=A0A1Y5RU61_9PROT|nr:arsenate reductase (glutaredoxin) [Oceanibacterium hippocampi]SLN25482.1 Arsenate reductase [Oceanibacterium hippocampi]
MSVTIYHNPRCSKSRETLALLQDRGIEPEIVEYLETPLDEAGLRDLIARLGISARDLLRTGEAEYKALGLADKSLDEATLVAAMAAHPKLMQRPVVTANGKAALGRPPEAVLDIL